jgi:hypothetical protein
MAKTPRKRPGREDANQSAFRTLQEAIGESEKTVPPGTGKDPAAVALGRKGGAARAKGMSKKKLSENAKKAAKARWTN